MEELQSLLKNDESFQEIVEKTTFEDVIELLTKTIKKEAVNSYFNKAKHCEELNKLIKAQIGFKEIAKAFEYKILNFIGEEARVSESEDDNKELIKRIIKEDNSDIIKPTIEEGNSSLYIENKHDIKNKEQKTPDHNKLEHSQGAEANNYKTEKEKQERADVKSFLNSGFLTPINTHYTGNKFKAELTKKYFDNINKSENRNLTELSKESVNNTVKQRASNTTQTEAMNTTILQLRGLSLRDALDIIPRFNGYNVPIRQFIDGLIEAKSILPEHAEKVLCKLIPIKLYDEAKEIARGQEFKTIEQIMEFFYSIFGPAKTYHEYLGELGKAKQGQNESIISFINRINSIENNALRAARRENRIVVESAFLRDFEKDKIKFFVKGLKWPIRSRMRPTLSWKQTRQAAIDLEREYTNSGEEERLIQVNTKEDEQRGTQEVRRVNYIESEQNEVVCTNCNEIGHEVLNCWMLAHEEGKEEAINTPNNHVNQGMQNACLSLSHWQNLHRNEFCRNNYQNERSREAEKPVCCYCNTPGHVRSECRILHIDNTEPNKIEYETYYLDEERLEARDITNSYFMDE